MIEKILAPMMVIDEMRTSPSKTRLQKLLYILETRVSENSIKPSYEYGLYNYGPFSFEVATIIDQLVHIGFIIEDPEATPTGIIIFNYFSYVTGIPESKFRFS